MKHKLLIISIAALIIMVLMALYFANIECDRKALGYSSEEYKACSFEKNAVVGVMGILLATGVIPPIIKLAGV